jgi:hypothetical protein
LEARVSGSRGCGGLESQGHGGEELCCQHVCEVQSGEAGMSDCQS